MELDGQFSVGGNSHCISRCTRARCIAIFLANRIASLLNALFPNVLLRWCTA